MRRSLRRLVIVLAILLVATSIGVVVLYSPIGGELLRRAAERGVSGLIAGSLRVGEVEFHGLDAIVARDARLLDPEGRVVVEAEELVLSVEPLALLRMELSLPEVVLRRGDLRLYEGEEGLPSFLDALGPAEPSEDDAPSNITARVPEIRIEDLDVHGDLLGVSGLRIEGASLEGGLEFLDDQLTLFVRTFHGLVTAPVERPLPVRGGDVVVGTAPEVGSRGSITAGDAEESITIDARIARPSPDAPEDVLDVTARLHAVRPETLAELGLAGADALTGEVSGTLEASGPIDALEVGGTLRHAAGELKIEGSIGETTSIRARSDRFAAKRLVPDAPDVAPSLDVTVTLEEGRAPRVDASISSMQVGGVTIPATRSTLSLEDDRLDVSIASTSLSTGELDVEGSVHHDGRLDLRARARLSSLEGTKELRALTGGMKGGASLDARVRGTLDDPRVRGGFVIAPFEYGPVRAARLSVSGDVHALEAAPSLSVDVVAKNVTLWDRRVDDVALTVRGKRGALAAIGSLGRDGAGTLDARFDLGETFRLHRGVVRTPRFKLDARDVLVSERVTELGAVHVQLGEARLTLSGTLRERGEDRIQLDVADLPLSEVRTVVDLPFEALDGAINVHAEAEGDLERDPSLFLQGVVEDIRGGGLEGAFASVFYRHTEGHSLGQLQIELGDAGSAAVGLNAYVDLGRDDLEAALREAYFDLSVDVMGFELARTQPVLPEELGEVSGQVDGSMRFSGTIDAIEADARVETRNMRVLDLPPLTYVVTVQKQYGSLSIDLAASDATGLLAEVRASTVGNVLAMLRAPESAAETLAAAPWLFYARIPERRLGDLPPTIAAELPEPLEEARVALSLDAQGGSLEPRVDLSGVILYPENVVSVCGAARAVSLPFQIEVRDGAASLDGELLLGSRVAGKVRGDAAPALGRWLERGEIEVTPVDLALTLDDARLGNLPFACELATGELSGALALRDFMGESPRLTGYFQSNSIRIRRDSETVPGTSVYETPPLSLGATIAIDTEKTLLDFTFRSGLESRLRVDGSAPVTLEPRGLARFDGDAPFSLFFDVEEAPLAILLGFVPAFANIEGVADGWGRFGGTLDAPEHHAELAIRDGRFTIVSLGQRVADVEGIATLDPGTLRLKHFRARDGDGRVFARGEMGIEDLAPTRAALDVELDGFPIRDEGTIVATLSGRGDLDASFTENSASAELVMRDLEIEMPTLGGPSIQDLAEHPDIRIVTELERAEDEEDALPFSLTLHVDATEPFEVKGPDFSATLTANLRVMLEDESLRIGGQVGLEGGRFSVLGKPFTVTSGSLRFDPRDETLSPAVSLEAVYLVDGDRNKRVTVSVGGTLSEPTIRFASNVPTRNEGEIISLIVTGETRAETERGVDSAAAGRDAADFVAGVAFGVVSLSLRDEFGGFLPVVTLEGQNRFRARFDAERFLPESVRKIVKRVRIEGYFTAGQPGEEGQVRQSGQARGAGFSVELGFPRGIVGRGTVAPPNNWSTQVLWEP